MDKIGRFNEEYLSAKLQNRDLIALLERKYHLREKGESIYLQNKSSSPLPSMGSKWVKTINLTHH